MLFCRKCGSPMGDEDHICLNCGTKVGKDPGSESKQELIKELTEYQTLLADNEELETMIKPQEKFPTAVPTAFKKRAFIGFFWPYIVGGTLSFFGIYIIAIAIAAFTNLDSYNPYTSSVSVNTVKANLVGDIYVGYFVAIIVAVAVFVIGIKVSRAKQRAFNSGVDRKNAEVTDRFNKGLLNQKMIELHTDNERKIRLYGEIVPEKYRTASQVASIITLIKEDKAATVAEACTML